ncbi:uncharacterized protein LOC110710615 [Chenopodium quinoa]|uniref:uncharacterized protein LOC110710615 n=1 Tax=Chenopodium quinoa TaxID=63459 RepID=UPI000B79967E|nr:uncharacterized protein LOC110710615 [Chenopodium quinoa]
MALKSRRFAQKLILGEYREQYSLLHRYAQEILRSNPDNSIKFKLNNNVFERVYVCFSALKKGFLAGCRPFFGLDGCFLNGPFGGQFLVAVGRDGNNQMFPIAWACVEIEKTETWTWFLELLADELGTVDGHRYTIISKAGQDFLKRNYKKWVRAYFTSQSTCDVIDNNMNEVFNAYILSSRHKPIITMLEDIRESLMERLHKKRDYIGNKDITICPRIKTRLEKSKMDARGWSAFWDGHYCYGVREGATQTRYVVSLLDKTCSCNAWQLSGVPCHHAVAAVGHPEHYVSDWFNKDTYLKAYAFPLELLNGPQQWPESPYEPI